MMNNESRGVRRAHSPDYETNYRGQQQFRGGPPGGGGGYHNQFQHKRHRGENYQQPLSIEDRIARIGETGFRNQEIGALSKEIDAELDNKANEEEKMKNLVSKICRCIVSFPTRVGTYATLIGLMSVGHYNISCQIVNTLHASYPVYLEAQKWEEALTIMHLLSCLVNCKVIRPSALLSQFEFILENTLEDNIPQARSDYYVYTVLSSLPYVAQELSLQTDQQETFESLLNTIETYLSKRSKEHLNVIRVWQSTDSTVQMDYLESLSVQMKNFRANNWNETFLSRPFNEKEYKDIMASSLVPFNSPTFQIPAHSDKYTYPEPRIVFRIFEDDVTDGPKSIPGSDKIERFCIENHIRYIIDEVSNDPRDCARHLCHMFRSDILPMKHLLIETVLGELLLVPKPKHQEVFYHTLLYEFSKIFQPSKNPDEMKYNYSIILNEAVKVLFENLDTMNVTCYDRFVDWFTFHLNNTEFLYPWQTWKDATYKEKESPKSLFVQDMLDRCIRLSFHQKIGKLVEADLACLMPPEFTVQYKPMFADNPKAGELAETIKKLIVQKAEGPTICETLNIIIDGVKLPEDFQLKEEKHSIKLLKIDIFTSVILSIASKSLTHLSSAIGKYRNVFRALTNIEQGQFQLLETLHSCLENHPQLQVILIDKLLKADLVNATEVCKWIFSDSMKPHHLKSYPWKLLDNTITRLKQIMNILTQEKETPFEEPKKEKSSEEGQEAGGDVEMKEEVDEEETASKREAHTRLVVEAGEKLEKATNDYKELILNVFRMFADVLGEHIRKCETSNTSYMDLRFKWLTGRMQQVYYRHYDTTRAIHDQIKTIIDDTISIGSSIINLNQ